MSETVCLAQIDVDPHAVHENIAKIKGIIEAHQDASLIVFPELVVHGHIYSTAPRHEIREMIARTPAGLREELHTFAIEHDTRVIFGEFNEVDGKIFNLAVYVSKDKIEQYAKTHVHWTESFDTGDELRAFDTPLERIGVLICFDASFPEAARVLALQGAKVIVTIAAVPRSFDVQYMHRRMAAIAIQNQVYSLFCNRVGRHFSGGSAVFDPRGNVVVTAGDHEEILLAKIDLAEVDMWRTEESIYPHRRPELYSKIVDHTGNRRED